MAKWKKVPPHRNPNYERVNVVRVPNDGLAHLDSACVFALEHDAVLKVVPREALGTFKPEYRKRKPPPE